MLKRICKEWNKFSNNDNILIYQMGKVGSTSLEEAIPSSIHLHRLYNINHNHVFYSPRRKSVFFSFLGSGFDMMRRVAIRRRKNVKIITLVRDVYSRNVSAYFQNLAFWIVKYSEMHSHEVRNDNSTFVFDAFEKVFDHEYPLTWFDKEINKFTGIDIFEYPFDKDKGYTIIEKGKYSILILKLEMLDELLPILHSFTNTTFDLKNSNKSEKKWYACNFKDFKQNYIPTDEYMDRLYNSKLSQHFYSPAETADFRSKAQKMK